MRATVTWTSRETGSDEQNDERDDQRVKRDRFGHREPENGETAHAVARRRITRHAGDKRREDVAALLNVNRTTVAERAPRSSRLDRIYARGQRSSRQRFVERRDGQIVPNSQFQVCGVVSGGLVLT